MKRFVCVPQSLAYDGMPEEVKKLSEESQLPISVSEEYSDIFIGSFPETFSIESPDSVENGYIYWLDITDEYNTFSKNVFIICKSLSNEYKFSPTLREKHILRFRFRIPEKNRYDYKIWNDDTMLYEGEFEVI